MRSADLNGVIELPLVLRVTSVEIIVLPAENNAPKKLKAGIVRYIKFSKLDEVSIFDALEILKYLVNMDLRD